MNAVSELIQWAWDEQGKGNGAKINSILSVCRRLRFRARVFHNLPLREEKVR
jgi:hypothetical protein